MQSKLAFLGKGILFAIPFVSIIVYSGTLFPFIVGKYVAFRALIELAVICALWVWAVYNKAFEWRSLVRNPLFIAVSAFVFFFVVAGLFGYDSASSFWSNYERGEGGFQMLHLYAFFVLLLLFLRTHAQWRRLFIFSLIAGFFVALFGFLSVAGVVHGGVASLCERFAGSLGNPAYMGTYALFMMFYAGFLLVEDWAKKGVRFLWGVFVVFFGAILLLSQTRGALIGLGVALVAGLLYLLFNLKGFRSRIGVVIAIAVLVVGGILGVVFRRSIDLLPFCNETGGNRILDISFAAETYQTRLALWQGAWQGFLQRPLLGWGPENFAPAIEQHFKPVLSGAWYDRAHNIFFDYLIMTGVLGFLAFVSIFAILFWRLLMKRGGALVSNVWGRALLVAMPVGYLVQGLVLFDVLPIYINIFLFLAFIVFLCEDKKPSLL